MKIPPLPFRCPAKDYERRQCVQAVFHQDLHESRFVHVIEFGPRAGQRDDRVFRWGFHGTRVERLLRLVRR